jgi:hypothetical protein
MVEDFKLYCIMKVGVNAGLGNEGMVRRELYQGKMFGKFQEIVWSEDPLYYQCMKDTHPEKLPPKLSSHHGHVFSRSGQESTFANYFWWLKHFVQPPLLVVDKMFHGGRNCNHPGARSTLVYF